MKTEDIKKGNNLIAEFVGDEKSIVPDFYHTKRFGYTQLEYDTDYNWLIPALEKFCHDKKALLTYKDGLYCITLEKVAVDGKGLWEVLTMALTVLKNKN